MLRPAFAGAAILILAVGPAFVMAEKPNFTITVERSKPDDAAAKQPFDGKRASVDVAILLDTSNSMDGLISQAKSQLWTIVQQFANVKKNGQTPILRVALFEYGNTRLPAAEGYIRQVVPLTDDLDKLSQSLFGLTTSGGDEYCGQVIQEAVKRLDWSKEPNGYKAIFIAGNEPFTQGPINYSDACKAAIEHGVVVNTIHCGASSEGVNGKWQHGAQLAEGESFNIDQDHAVVQIKCPQDTIIIKLNAELNKTYLWFGAKDKREAYAANQADQDRNASSIAEGVASTRAAAKASGAYRNESRDLVDTLQADKEILSKLKADELPAELKDKTPAAREAIVKEMTAKRAEIQKQINALAAEREAYVAKEQKRLATESGKTTLGEAVVTTIQKQLAKSGFETGSGK
jgi:hypothetical protein